MDNVETLTSAASAALSARNATIQLLRDGLYRACEAYATGALNRVEYVGIVGQYQNVMLALLSIELLTDINRQEHAAASPNRAKGSVDDGTSGDSIVGEPIQPPNIGLTHGSIATIADTVQTLVLRVLGIERERAYQPRLTECFQQMLDGNVAVRDELAALCQIMMGQMFKGTVADSTPESLDTDISLEYLADKIRNPDGIILVDVPRVIDFAEGEELKVLAVEISADGVYDIELMDDIDLSGADPALIVVRAHDLEIIDHDDDSGSGLNAHVAVTLQSGRYLIHAMSLERAAARFRLSIKRSPDGEGDDQAGDDAISKERSDSGEETVSEALRDLLPEANAMESSIDVGVKRDIQFARDEEMRSFEFIVSVEGDYVVTALSESEGAGDPALLLMDGEGDIVGVADDSGSDLNARLEVRLSAGSYELVIFNMDGRAAMFEVLVQNMDGGEDASNDEGARHPYLRGKHESTHSELSSG